MMYLNIAFFRAHRPPFLRISLPFFRVDNDGLKIKSLSTQLYYACVFVLFFGVFLRHQSFISHAIVSVI